MATYGTHVAVSVLSLASVLIVARVLGATGRGDIAFLITIATLSSQFALLGIPDATGNMAGSRPELRPQLATNSLIFSVVFGLMCATFVNCHGQRWLRYPITLWTTVWKSWACIGYWPRHEACT